MRYIFLCPEYVLAVSDVGYRCDFRIQSVSWVNHLYSVDDEDISVGICRYFRYYGCPNSVAAFGEFRIVSGEISSQSNGLSFRSVDAE